VIDSEGEKAEYRKKKIGSLLEKDSCVEERRYLTEKF